MKPNQITLLHRLVCLVFVSALLVVVGAGCNTTHGFGKDVSKTGDWIQKESK